MTTSSHSLPPSDLPDAAELQRLANAWFQALPGQAPATTSAALPVEAESAGGRPVASPLELGEHGIQGTRVHSLAQPQSSLADPHAGVASQPAWSPGAAAAPAELDPRRSFSQPGGGTFASAGTGVHGQPPATLPLADEQPFERELQRFLAVDSVDRQTPQLPLSGAGASGFYFIDQRRPGPPGGLLAPALPPSSQLQGKAGPWTSAERAPLQLAAAPAQLLDVERIRRDFPVLRERVNGRPLVWLDNAATTQKPHRVIERLREFYEHENSNIHRAAHALAARATDAYEGARETVRAFINARSANEIVFTRGTTESINLVAQTWGRSHIGEGDEIIVSHLEHHANIVPWHRLAAEKGARLKVMPVDDDGQILLDAYAALITPRTKLVAFTQVSNALGTVTPAQRIIEIARAAGVTVLLDGAQSVSHKRVDLQALQPDFFVFSGHKVFGPTGIGVLYGREELLNSLPPWQGGGNMIQDVTFERILYHDAPNRFEAGTGNIADAVGLGAAIDYVNQIGIDVIDRYEHQLLVYATRLLREVPGLRLIGTAADKASVLSFTLDGYSTEAVGGALNEVGIAVRSGHHCAQPILRRFGVETTVRPSLAFYNTTAEVDLLAATLHRLQHAHRPVFAASPHGAAAPIGRRFG